MAHIIEEKWNEILSFIETEYTITKASYDLWIRNLCVKKVEDDIVYLFSTDSTIIENYDHIKKKYGNFIKNAIQEVTECECIIRFDSLSDDDTKKTSVKQESALNVGLPLNPDYTFDNFVVSKNNQFAYVTALKAAETPGDTYNPLFIYGDSGLGKTHLMQSIGHFILENDPDKKVLYVTSDIFTNELISSIRQGNLAPAAFREKYRNIDVLLIDDIQFIIGKASTQEEFFYTFNALYEAKKQIVITSDKPPRDFTTLDERWRSRFGWGLIVDLTSPDYETKIAILQKKLEIKRSEGTDIDISDDVLSYMAENINSNIRTLEGALTKVIAQAKLQRTTVTKKSAEYALRDILTPNQKKILTPEFIIEVVSEHFHVSVNDILSEKRDKKTAIPRQIAMYLSVQYTKYNMSEISKIFKKDHSTVHSNISRIEKLMKENVELSENINVLTNKINPER